MRRLTAPTAGQLLNSGSSLSALSRRDRPRISGSKSSLFAFLAASDTISSSVPTDSRSFGSLDSSSFLRIVWAYALPWSPGR